MAGVIVVLVGVGFAIPLILYLFYYAGQLSELLHAPIAMVDFHGVNFFSKATLVFQPRLEDGDPLKPLLALSYPAVDVVARVTQCADTGYPVVSYYRGRNAVNARRHPRFKLQAEGKEGLLEIKSYVANCREFYHDGYVAILKQNLTTIEVWLEPVSKKEESQA